MMAAACVKNLVYVAVGNTQCNLHLLTLDSGGTGWLFIYVTKFCVTSDSESWFRI